MIRLFQGLAYNSLTILSSIQYSEHYVGADLSGALECLGRWHVAWI